MILAIIQDISTAQIMIESASKLAIQLKKPFGVLTSDVADEFELKNRLPEGEIYIRNSNEIDISTFCEEEEASFLFLQMLDNKTKSIRKLLEVCRDLRIPYILYKNSYSALNLSKVLLPIGFLIEELEKAQFASAFGRFCGSQIQILLANDYGSKALVNSQKMCELFDKFQLNYKLQKATKDSFKVENEAAQIAENEGAGIVIVSASRDYGLDDIIFGPKELHVVKRSTVPILLVNPRGDLYALCD